MNNRAASLIFLGLVVFLAGCVKETSELQFKNDVVTIENYFVSNVAPYEKGKASEATPVSMQFELHNNGDQTIPYLEVDFFDTPGFILNECPNGYTPSDSSKEMCVCYDVENKFCVLKSLIPKSGLECPIGERAKDSVGNPLPKCVFSGVNQLEPLDVRGITAKLKSTEDVISPTPHTVSFALRYTYFGSRDVSIPVIDGQTRKQPLTKFRQNDPSVGPIALDVDPSIEREIIAADKTIRENWAIGGNNPLPFLTKFKFTHTGSLSEKVKDVNITWSSLRLKLNGLSQEGTCDFCIITGGVCKNNFNKIQIRFEGQDKKLGDVLVDSHKRFYQISPASDISTLEKSSETFNFYSTKSTLVPFDTLICTFKPAVNQPEYSASISAFFAYKYEFIKSQDFVIQPLPE